MRDNKAFKDDGRVIANMNIEGTPWYRPKRDSCESASRDGAELTGKETYHMVRGALMAALLIGIIFVGSCFLFLLFCTNIWFR